MIARTFVMILACACAGIASAKDKPPPKRDDPRPVTGCEDMGREFVKLPGSDTCVKVSGSARMEGATILRR